MHMHSCLPAFRPAGWACVFALFASAEHAAPDAQLLAAATRPNRR